MKGFTIHHPIISYYFSKYEFLNRIFKLTHHFIFFSLFLPFPSLSIFLFPFFFHHRYNIALLAPPHHHHYQILTLAAPPTLSQQVIQGKQRWFKILLQITSHAHGMGLNLWLVTYGESQVQVSAIGAQPQVLVFTIAPHHRTLDANLHIGNSAHQNKLTYVQWSLFLPLSCLKQTPIFSMSNLGLTPSFWWRQTTKFIFIQLFISMLRW